MDGAVIAATIEDVASATDVTGLEAVLARVAVDLRYTGAAYYRLVRLGSSVAPTLAFGCAFDAWVDLYIERGYAAQDPVVPLAFRRDLPFSAREAEADFPEPAALHADRRRLWAPDGLFCPMATSWGEVGVLCWASDSLIEISDGERLAMGMISRAVVSQFKTIASDDTAPRFPLRPLARRESECAYWAAQGLTGREIALTLGLSAHTVRQYLESAVQKLQARNRAEMLLRAAALGLISEPSLSR